jgi:hypothetical protein
MRTALPMLAIVVSLFSANCYAKETSTHAWIDRNPEASFAVTPPEAPHRHSSTYQEGVQRGYAAVVRAHADAVLQDAQARIFHEQAYSMHIDNALNLTKAQFERKRMIASYYHQDRIDRIVRREELRQLKSIEELRDALDNPLNEYDVNFQTGSVYWPALVAGPKYSQYRRELDLLASKILVSGSRATATDREELVSLCNKFRQQLREDMQAEVAKDLPSVKAEYAAVDRLLKGLRSAPLVMAEAPVNTVSMN